MAYAGAESGRDEDIIPTFRTLQQSASLQDKVRQRYNELEQAHESNGGNSNIDLLVKPLQEKSEHNKKCKVAP